MKKLVQTKGLWVKFPVYGILFCLFNPGLSMAAPLDPNDNWDETGRIVHFSNTTFTKGIVAAVEVRGTVVDNNGDPIPGVTVSVSGTSTGTATDLEGKYSLSVPEGSTLVFSFIGFETQ